MADNEPVLIPLRLETIRIAFMQLGDRVNAALRTQIGDRLRLQEHNGGVLRMLEAIQQVCLQLICVRCWLNQNIHTEFQCYPST
jgi:hypothetical protein